MRVQNMFEEYNNGEESQGGGHDGISLDENEEENLFKFN